MCDIIEYDSKWFMKKFHAAFLTLRLIRIGRNISESGCADRDGAASNFCV